MNRITINNTLPCERRQVKTRKPHTCAYCGVTIAPRETVTYECGLTGDGEPYRHYICGHCGNMSLTLPSPPTNDWELLQQQYETYRYDYQ